MTDIEKNKVLPIVDVHSDIYWGAVAQQEADWAQVKPLVEALEAIAHFRIYTSDRAVLGLGECQLLAQQALARLSKEEKL